MNANFKSRICPTTTRSVAALAFLLTFSLCHAALAQQWPTKPIKIIGPFPAGVARDGDTRFFAEKLTGILGQQVYVENRPGAAGRMAGQAAVNAAPDGYTFNMMGTTDILTKYLYKLSYDMERDLVAVTMIKTAPAGIVVRPSLPAKSLTELISLAKDHPGKMTYGSTGAGGFLHVNALLFSNITNTKFGHVPYASSNPVTDVLGGHIDMVFDGIGPGYLGNIKAGKLRALAVTGEKRTSALPDVPTFIESGVPAYDTHILYGLFAPKDTPESIVVKMQQAISQILQEPVLRHRWQSEGAIPVGSTSAEFAGRIRSESERWGTIIRANNIKLE
jgi:tripartite-type tricarboxylate transporter receptor subunit TctC